MYHVIRFVPNYELASTWRACSCHPTVNIIKIKRKKKQVRQIRDATELRKTEYALINNYYVLLGWNIDQEERK